MTVLGVDGTADGSTAAPADEAPASISSDEYHRLTGETLGQTVDLSRWKRGVEVLKDYDRLQAEITEAETISDEVRRAIREHVFPTLPHNAGAPKEAGVFIMTESEVRQTQRDVLMNGLAESVDGNVHVMTTMALQIVQIAVVAASYGCEESSWAHRIFKRDIRVQPGANMVEETLRLLHRRSPDQNGPDKPRKVTEMMRRGVMTLMERQVLADALQAPWRIGHGNPLAYELLTGAGSADLIRLSVPVLRRVIDHRKFLYVSSDTSEQHFKTIGDALRPLEYAIIASAESYIDRIRTGGHFRGEWETAMSRDLGPFLDDVQEQVVVGTYRATPFAPAQIFYAHRDYAHEAARIAIADSVHLDHRGFPMLIEIADSLCRGYFGAQTLERPTFAAFGNTDAPFRHLGERSTRA